MRAHKAFTLVFALPALVVVVTTAYLYTRQERVVDVADWNESSRTLRLAAPMPSCGCLTMTPRQQTIRTKAVYFWDRLLSWRFGPDATDEVRPRESPATSVQAGSATVPDRAKDVVLVSSMSRSASLIGYLPLGGNARGWSFAFDWAGALIGTTYEVQGFAASSVSTTSLPDGTTQITVDENAHAVDLNSLYYMEAVPQPSCSDTALAQCPWGTLRLNKASGEAVGQNAVESTFTGVRISRGDRVLEAQATGTYRGASGDCGCMMLEVVKPTVLFGALRGGDVGRLELNRAGEIVKLPFDIAGPRGDDYYELRIGSGEPFTGNLRLIGQIDGISCSADGARFDRTPPSLVAALAQPADSPAHVQAQKYIDALDVMLTCPKAVADPTKMISGTMDLMQAYNESARAARGATPTNAQAVPPADGRATQGAQ